MVVRKYENISTEINKKMKLHQKSVFHPRFSNSDMPASFWAPKTLALPQQGAREPSQQERELIEVINDLSQTEDGAFTPELVAQFRKNLFERGDLSFLTEEQQEVALKFYSRF